MKFDNPTLVTITAPTCSGKSFILDHLTKDLYAAYRKDSSAPVPLFNRIISTTTRAPREGEVNGVDYHFISKQQSLDMEERSEFAELIEFRGQRYGVTKAEMDLKMTGSTPPAIILEPKGLTIYEQLCWNNGWDIFKIYVYTQEEVRIKRLGQRTALELRNKLSDHYRAWTDTKMIQDVDALDMIERIVDGHNDRLLSITSEERCWHTSNNWDVMVPGDDFKKAVADIKIAVEWRNKKRAVPKPHFA